jgi:hypothetical protein
MVKQHGIDIIDQITNGRDYIHVSLHVYELWIQQEYSDGLRASSWLLVFDGRKIRDVKTPLVWKDAP